MELAIPNHYQFNVVRDKEDQLTGKDARIAQITQEVSTMVGIAGQMFVMLIQSLRFLEHVQDVQLLPIQMALR